MTETLPEGDAVFGIGRGEGAENRVPAGTDAMIFCPFAGLDEPSARFFRLEDGVFVEIVNGTGPYLILDAPAGNGIILTITDFSGDFAGTYQCVATNVAGEVSATSVLIGISLSLCVLFPLLLSFLFYSSLISLLFYSISFFPFLL